MMMMTAAAGRVSPTRRLLSDCECGRRTAVPRTNCSNFVKSGRRRRRRRRRRCQIHWALGGGKRPARRVPYPPLRLVGVTRRRRFVQCTRHAVFFSLYIYYYYYYIYFSYYSLPAKPPGIRGQPPRCHSTPTETLRRVASPHPPPPPAFFLLFLLYSSVSIALFADPPPAHPTPHSVWPIYTATQCVRGRTSSPCIHFLLYTKNNKSEDSCPLRVSFFFPYFFPRPSRRMVFVSVCVRTQFFGPEEM